MNLCVSMEVVAILLQRCIPCSATGNVVFDLDRIPYQSGWWRVDPFCCFAENRSFDHIIILVLDL